MKITLISFAMILCISGHVFGVLSGSGTEADPYLIQSRADFDEFANPSNAATYWASGKYTKLMCDIDLAGTTYTQAVIAPDTSTSSGFQGTQFLGIFDGNNHIISGLTISSTTDYIGLFGYTGSGGQVKNLGIENASIQGKSYIGGLTGYNSLGIITSCYVMGTVTGTGTDAGGLVGNNNRILTSCHFTGTVAGKDNLGGLAGYASSSTITSCYATGAVNGNSNSSSSVGGLIGKTDSFCTISACYTTNTVSGKVTAISLYSYVGGLVGYNQGTITSCCTTGNVSGESITYASVGGLVGISTGTATTCYATGNIAGFASSGYAWVGGLAGSSGIIASCYATGSINGNARDGFFPGGLAGGGSGLITACFWDTQTTGQTGSSGGKGLTTAQMKTMSIFQNAGWSQYGWVMQDGVAAPRLAWEGTAGTAIPEALPVPLLGSGTPEDPYQIWTSGEFVSLGWYPSILDKYIVLMADVNMADVPMTPISNIGPFSGVFEGNGHVIENVVINQPSSDHVGLIGRVDTSGQIHNLRVENISITGRNFVGGLTGYNYGSITLCHVVGTINGNDSFVGGLVGLNVSPGNIWSCDVTGDVAGNISKGDCIGGLVGRNYSGTITDSNTAATVRGKRFVGGFIGENYVNIVSCYATGNVRGHYPVGGLVGYNNTGGIINCYAAGSVSGDSTSDNIGGLVGKNEGSIIYSYAAGAVTGYGKVGGLVGENYYSSITNCFATGKVVGGTFSFPYSNVGGLVGYAFGGTITNCYATGQVSATHISSDVGGLIGERSCTVVNSFWDTDTSGTQVGVDNGSSTGVYGRSTVQMKQQATFTDYSWDFTNETAKGTADIWRMCADGVDYPRLNWESIDGDFACPDAVAIEDLGYFVGKWLSAVCTASNNYCGGADINTSGTVELADYAIFAQYWLEGR